MNIATVESLLATYRRTFREEHYSGIWRGIFDQHHRELHDVFIRGTPEQAAELLGNPGTNYLHYGFDNSFKGCGEGQSSDIGALLSLAVALGADRLPNPEHRNFSLRYKLGVARRQWLETAETILKRLDAVRPGIDFPNPFPGDGGIVTTRGMASHRAINAVYQASILKGKVVEIGGGLGRTAYYAIRFGITDYTIVDLPFTGLSQGYFLAATLGPDHPVKLISPNEFFDSADTYDVAFNADSFTEIGRPTAERYAAALRSRCGSLVSINHESNTFTVRELFGRAMSRHPYWLRPGYVEERFQL